MAIEAWLRADDSIDAPMVEQYVSSFQHFTGLWSRKGVTCTTVGYGDILPVNEYEIGWAAINILVGVVFFSIL